MSCRGFATCVTGGKSLHFSRDDTDDYCSQHGADARFFAELVDHIEYVVRWAHGHPKQPWSASTHLRFTLWQTGAPLRVLADSYVHSGGRDWHAPQDTTGTRDRCWLTTRDPKGALEALRAARNYEAMGGHRYALLECGGRVLAKVTRSGDIEACT